MGQTLQFSRLAGGASRVLPKGLNGLELSHQLPTHGCVPVPIPGAGNVFPLLVRLSHSILGCPDSSLLNVSVYGYVAVCTCAVLPGMLPFQRVMSEDGAAV